MELLPKSGALNRLGFGSSDIEDVNSFLNLKLSGISEDILGVLRGVRRRVYVSGIVDPEDLHEKASMFAVREQREMDGLVDPVNQESKDAFTERLRRWRNFLAYF
jgi:hypothetical protein